MLYNQSTQVCFDWRVNDQVWPIPMLQLIGRKDKRRYPGAPLPPGHSEYKLFDDTKVPHAAADRWAMLLTMRAQLDPIEKKLIAYKLGKDGWHVYMRAAMDILAILRLGLLLSGDTLLHQQMHQCWRNVVGEWALQAEYAALDKINQED